MFLDKLYKQLDDYNKLLNEKVDNDKKNNIDINDDEEIPDLIDKIDETNNDIKKTENEVYALILDEKIDDFSVEFNTIKNNFKNISKNDINKDLYDEYEKRSEQLDNTLSKLKDLKNNYNTKNILSKLKKLEYDYNNIIKDNNDINDNNLKDKINNLINEIKKEKNRINTNAYYKLINKKQNELKNIEKDTREANKINKDIIMLKNDIYEKNNLEDVKNELFTNISVSNIKNDNKDRHFDSYEDYYKEQYIDREHKNIKYKKQSLSELASEGPLFKDEERIDPNYSWLSYDQAKNLGHIRDISDYIDIPEEVEEKENIITEKIQKFRENNPLKSAWKNLSSKAKAIINKKNDGWEMIK